VLWRFGRRCFQYFCITNKELRQKMVKINSKITILSLNLKMLKLFFSAPLLLICLQLINCKATVKSKINEYNNFNYIEKFLPDSEKTVLSAVQLIRRHEVDSALNVLKEYLNNGGINIFSHILLGDIYRVKNHFDSSLNCFNDALKIDSTNPNIYRIRSLLWRDMQKYSNVIIDLNKALYYGEEDSFCYVNRGLAFDLTGEHEKAISDYKKAIAIDSLNPIAYNNLGRLYLNKGLFQKACQFCSTSTVIKVDYVEAFDCYGAALYNTGRFTEAKKVFLKAINIAPNDSIAYFYLKRIYGK
jgi:tetratricopeptide (TPR) repeat protein